MSLSKRHLKDQLQGVHYSDHYHPILATLFIQGLPHLPTFVLVWSSCIGAIGDLPGNWPLKKNFPEVTNNVHNENSMIARHNNTCYEYWIQWHRAKLCTVKIAVFPITRLLAILCIKFGVSYVCKRRKFIAFIWISCYRVVQHRAQVPVPSHQISDTIHHIYWVEILPDHWPTNQMACGQYYCYTTFPSSNTYRKANLRWWGTSQYCWQSHHIPRFTSTVNSTAYDVHHPGTSQYS